MTGDIVEKLRDSGQACWCSARCEGECICDLVWPGGAAEAADEIDRLRTLITQWRDAYDLRSDGMISSDDYVEVFHLLRAEARHG
jgi:hypothetical protein